MNLENPDTVGGMVEAASHYISNIRLALTIGDVKNASKFAEQAARLLFNAECKLEETEPTVPCERCGGQGWYPQFDHHGRETHQDQCEACHGTGRVEKVKPLPNK